MSLRVLSDVIAAAAVLATAPATAATYDQVVVFGDSLVDAGNVFLATGGFAATNTFNNPSRGYFPGRFTNGPDYTDLLNAKLFGTYSTAALAGGSNYAFGGATYVANNDPVPDLAAQVGLYATGSVAFGLSAHAVDPNALYIINFGGNDVFAIDSGAVPAAFVPAYTLALTNVLGSTLQALDAGGAKNILVTGIPNTTATGFALEALVQAKLDALQPTLANATLRRFSYQSFFTRLATNPAAFGVAPFTHAGSDGCFNHLTPPATADCSGYFTVDGTHPIAPIQAAIFREVVQVAGVPEPAAWSLLIVGFGLVGLAVRRRAGVAA